MKIDRSKLKKNNSEVPHDCGWLIEKLNKCNDHELLPLLKSIESWNFGKCELHHWINVLDRFDSILENATKKNGQQWVLPCDLSENSQMQELVVWVLYFTTLLVEHSFSRHLYSSLEHLITLLSSSSMTIVLSVLNLLYMFSKRSNYITRLANGPKQQLLARLIHLAESWGGKENGFGLAQCCQNLPLSSFPEGATTLHFEFYDDQKTSMDATPSSASSKSHSSSAVAIHLSNIQFMNKSSAFIMEELLPVYKVPVDKQMVLFTHLRLAHSFSNYETRLQCVQARLQAISILVYCNALQDNAHTVLYSGLLDEFVDVLELKNTNITEIKAATLRTLTSIIHLERYPNFPKLTTIIDVTGASSYHGFLPALVRSCITTLTSSPPVELNPFPAPLATSLFSFLYHLASYEAGGEALVACGMMESLLSVVTWFSSESDHITFVTRAVRVIDLITNLDVNAFQNHGGLNVFIRRLELEVNECRKDQPFVIQLPTPLGVSPDESNSANPQTGGDSEMQNSTEGTDQSLSAMEFAESTSRDLDREAPIPDNTIVSESFSIHNTVYDSIPSTSKSSPPLNNANATCLPQRGALLKSMLNFLKKDIQDPGFSENMRHLMESSLPSSLKHIISNSEYYGPSLFLLATDVVTVYVFGEPSLLSSLQDNGLTDVVLHALLVKDVPATREVLASLPNVFSALCLNSRGLQAFVACKPFERLFKVLLSPDYLPAMRRRKSSDPLGDTASNLGNAMDELMRHQPSLKTQAMAAIVKLLEEVCLLGSDAHYVCSKPPSKVELPLLPSSRSTNDNSSDEDEEEEEGESPGAVSTPLELQENCSDAISSGSKKPVPLVDYVLNVMKFVDAILSNNSTDDHCKEFVSQKGLVPLLGILGLPNLPIDFPVSQACQAVSCACKSILNLAHESGVLEQGLHCLQAKLEALSPLHDNLPSPKGSVLYKELSAVANMEEAVNSPTLTPLLHNLSAVHAYIIMLVHVCRTGQADIRQVSVKQWGTELGLKVLSGLSDLYTSLVWESTVLLAMCSEDSSVPFACFVSKDDPTKNISSFASINVEDIARVTSMALGESDDMASPLDSKASGSDGKSSSNSHQMKLIKPLLSSASRLGKALAELFGLLGKLSVGSPLRQRRGQQVIAPSTPPSSAAVAVASALSNILYSGLSWVPPPSSSITKFRLRFLVCSVRFMNPMLFDDKKMPYHLMLQHFVKSNGLKAFFSVFYWALELTDPSKNLNLEEESSQSINDSIGEFLDTWLFLLEKLVNPKSVLESPHSLPSKLGFCPLKFFVQVQKLAFDAVMKLWNAKPLKSYGVKISESVLVILCSILKGENEIVERCNREQSSKDVYSTTITPTNANPDQSRSGAGLSSVNFPSSSEIHLPRPTANSSEVATSVSTNVASSSAPATSSEDIPPPASSSLSTSIVSAIISGTSDLGASTTARPAATLPSNEPPSLLLQPLLDMGFPLDRCLEAIAHTSTLEQATEYLLNNTTGSHGETDMDFSEDEQWLHAVALSLRDVRDSLTPKLQTEKETSATESVVTEEPLSREDLDKFTLTVLEGCLSQLDVQPLLVYKVCELLNTCASRNGFLWKENMLKTLISQISQEASELIEVCRREHNQETAEYLCSSKTAYKFAIRLHLVTLLFEEMKSGCAGALEEANLIEVLVELLCSSQKALSIYPHILTSPKNEVEPSKEGTEKSNKPEEATHSPKWLAPTMLLVDLYEKLSVATKRRAAVKKVTNRVWKWFDVSQVRWYGYTLSNNRVIDEAYWAGESSVRIVNSRRKYTIQFNTMLQVNEETGNRRPVMICISDKCVSELKKKVHEAKGTSMTSVTDAEKEKMHQTSVASAGDSSATGPAEHLSVWMHLDSDDDATLHPMECSETSKEKEKTNDQATTPKSNLDSPFVIKGFDEASKQQMIIACVGFMKLSIDPDTLHALMRLCLRLTREWENACLFARIDGVRTLLSLNETSSFWGFQNLAALLMRHILEEPSTLKHTMKKIVRFAAGKPTGVAAKELHSLLRALAPAACRDPSTFLDVTQQCLRIDLNTALKRNLMTTSQEDSILMKSVGSKGSSSVQCSNNGTTQPPVQQMSAENSEPHILIQDLLKALGAKEDEDGDEVTPAPAASTSTSAEGKSMTSSSSLRFSSGRLNLSRSSSANDMVVQDIDDQSPVENESPSRVIAVVETKNSVDDISAKKKKLLLSKSFLCKLLAEFIRSYSGVAKIVTEFQYSAGLNDKISEDSSALAYLLHQIVNEQTETDMVNYVRVLIAALSSCNHSPDAQVAVVSEVKTCLSRIVNIPESPDKHGKIQLILSLILTMMESCPTQLNQPVNACFKQQMGMNNMIRIMIKKNLVTDLARIPHCLDLSSPNMAATINASLKPLETVLRIVNMPSFVSLSGTKKKSSSTSDQHQLGGTSATNSEATRAQGEENAEDAENTEHDISATGESLEPNSEVNASEEGVLVEGDESELADILHQLLDSQDHPIRESSRTTPHGDTVTGTVTYVIDHDAPIDMDDGMRDSRMVSHSNSQFLDDTEERRNDDRDGDSTGSSDDNERDEDDDEDHEEDVEVEGDDDEDDEADEDDDDEDDDEEDEDEEEEEGDSSVFDQGGYDDDDDDLEETFFRLPVDRDVSGGGVGAGRAGGFDDFLYLPSYQQYINTIDTIIFGDRISLAHAVPPHDDSVYMTSTPNNTSANLSSAIPTHPLFQNPRDSTNPVSRVANRPSRQRGLLRLLGQTQRDVLQFTSNIREATQLIIGNPDVRIIQQNDDMMEPQEFENNLTSRASNVGPLPGVPNALTRWMEEARVLESDSMHDAVTQVKPELMSVLEYFRDLEQAERDRKKKETADEEAATKPSTDSKSAEASAESDASVTSMATSTTSTVINSTFQSEEPVITTAASDGTAASESRRNLIISILEQQFSTAAFTSSTSSTPSYSDADTNVNVTSTAANSVEVTAPPLSETSQARTSSPLTFDSSSRTSALSVIDSLAMSFPLSSASSIVTSTATDLTVTPVSAFERAVLNLTQTSTPNVQLLSTPLMSAPLPTMRETEGQSSPNFASISLAPSVMYELPPPNVASELTIEESMSISPTEFSLLPSTPVPQASTSSQTPPVARGSGGEANTDNNALSHMETSPIDLQQAATERVDQQTSNPESSASMSAPSSSDATTSQSTSAAGGSATAESAVTSELTAILGDIEIPEGVDPSFLAALPEDMRREVISEQLRIQRVRNSAINAASDSNPAEVSEVSAEFLAALPPNIQEEVLSQQRVEQERQQAARANPDDPTSFLLSLPQTLRQTILSDLEDSQFSALPTEVVQEAQTLRRQREDRGRHAQEHMFGRSGSSSISHILRNTARMGSRFMHSPNWSSWGVRPTATNQQISTSSRVRGQQILDHESLTCLLVLLFLDEPKLNTTRLHKVIKSLCQHPPTRDWIIKTLLSIIEHCGEHQPQCPNGKSLNESEASLSGLSLEMASKRSDKASATSFSSSAASSGKVESRTFSSPQWLSMSMDAALGCRANIFQISRLGGGGKKTAAHSTASIRIHPQAAPLICRHAIDLLISLAKIFPSHFLPSMKEAETNDEKKSGSSCAGSFGNSNTKSLKGASNTNPNSSSSESTEFWDLLIKLDSVSVSRKGKGLPRTHSSSNSISDQDVRSAELESSPLGMLIQQLAHPVIKKSSLLTDRLLRLLALVSLGHPDNSDVPAKKSATSEGNMKSLEHLLGLSIEVLTSKSCSEEGLEDATALLLHLSHGPSPARDMVLKLLLQGATTLGRTVTIHIGCLLEELRNYNESHPPTAQEDDAPQQQSDKSKKGVLKDRFTADNVVIASSKVKSSCEVQLASMSDFTSKISSQAFFLRTLKVIIQLRDVVKLNKSKKNKPSSETRININVSNTNSNVEGQSTASTVPAATASSEENPQDQTSQQMEGISNDDATADQTVQDRNASQDTVLSAAASGDAPCEAMDVDEEGPPTEELKSLSWELGLDDLWDTLSLCLMELAETSDPHAVLVLQPAVEAFFLVHASNATTQESKAKPTTPQETREAQLAHLQHEIAPLSPLPASQSIDDGNSAVKGEKDVQGDESSIVNDAQKFLKFAGKHRSVLNQILRQSTGHLADGPFNVLVDHTRLLDFDIKRKYFRTELERADDGIRREDLAVHVRREHVFEDSFRELHRRSADEWKNRFYIVFEGEEGQDAGGLLREWYVIISREIFNPMYALFCTSPGDRVTYMINPSSHCNSNHLSYFKFVGRVIAKAIYDNKLLECYFTRSFYKHILGVMVRVSDMESEDYSFYQGLIYLMEHHVADLGYELMFSTEVQEFGVTEARDLKPGGCNIMVTEENKYEYIRLVCQEKMTGAIKKQLNSFLEGFYDIIPKRLISIFNEQELELLLSGLPTIDIEDLKNNTEYHKYHPSSLQIQWFWRALRSFDQAERAKLVQFVTGTSKVPLQGFSALEGMNGTQKFQIHRDDRSTDRLPSAHTCFNQLDLPAYETYDKLRHYLLKAVQECSEGFGFA